MVISRRWKREELDLTDLLTQLQDKFDQISLLVVWMILGRDRGRERQTGGKREGGREGEREKVRVCEWTNQSYRERENVWIEVYLQNALKAVKINRCQECLKLSLSAFFLFLSKWHLFKEKQGLRLQQVILVVVSTDLYLSPAKYCTCCNSCKNQFK